MKVLFTLLLSFHVLVGMANNSSVVGDFFSNLLVSTNELSDLEMVQGHINNLKNIFSSKEDPEMLKQLKDWLSSGPERKLSPKFDQLKSNLVTNFNQIKVKVFPEKEEEENEKEEKEESTVSEEFAVVTVTYSYTETVTETFDRIETSTEVIIEPTTVVAKAEEPIETSINPHVLLEPSTGQSVKDILNNKGPSHSLFMAPQFRQHVKDGEVLENIYAKPKISPILNSEGFVSNEVVKEIEFKPFELVESDNMKPAKIETYEDDEYIYNYIYDSVDKDVEIDVGDQSDGKEEDFSKDYKNLSAELTTTSTTTTALNITRQNVESTKPIVRMKPSTFSNFSSLSTHRSSGMSTSSILTTFNQWGDDYLGNTNLPHHRVKAHRRNHTRVDFNFLRGFPNNGNQNNIIKSSMFAAIILIVFSILLL